MKRALIFISITIGLLLAGATYYSFFEVSRDKISLYKLVPDNAALIFKVNDSKNFKNNTQKSKLWKDLKSVSLFEKYEQAIVFLDSVAISPEVLVSVHNTGAKSFDLLHLMRLPPNKRWSVEKMMNQVSDSKVIFSKRKFKDHDVYDITMPISELTYTCTILDDIWVGSFTPFLVDYAIIQLEKQNSILDDKAFQQVKQLSGKSYDLTVYVSYENLPKLLSTFVNSQNKEWVAQLGAFAAWSEIDIVLKEKELFFNGYTVKKDQPSFIDVLTTQPTTARMMKYLPADISFMYYLNGEKVSDLIQDRNSSHSDTGLVDYSWVGSELAYVVNESYDSDFSDESYVVVQVKDEEQATSMLLGASMQDVSSETYKEDYSIYRVFTPTIMKSLFHEQYNGMSDPYFTVIKDYIFLSENSLTLRSVIDAYVNQNTISKDFEYIEFLENLTSNINMYVYMRQDKLLEILKGFVNEELEELLSENSMTYKKFGRSALQFSYQRDAFFTNGYIAHGEHITKESELLWSMQLGAPITQQPTYVANHNNDQVEILVQNDNNELYLLSKGGHVLWKRQIDKKILGRIYQIDFYSNDKLQYFFNTEDKIYLIDRNGNDVAKYPLRLNDKASNPVFLVDYDENKKYRFFIASKNGNLYGFEKTGKPLSGWNPKKNLGIISRPIQHFSQDGKDYIVAVNDSGIVHIFNRRGEYRIKPTRIVTHLNNPFYINKSSKPYKIITTDSAGVICGVSTNGEISKFQGNATLSKEHQFMYTIINKKPQNVFLDKNTLRVNDIDGNLLYDYTFQDTSNNFGLFETSDLVGVINYNKNEVYLFNSIGRPAPGAPLQSSTIFKLKDVYKDGGHIAILGTPEGELKAISITGIASF